jgi:hypothetical protein
VKSKLLALAVVGSMALLSIGCVTQAPMINSVDVTQVDYSTPMKQSKDCGILLLGLIGPFGEASMVSAIRKAKITKVKALEYSSDYYVLFSRFCVDVWGE